MDAPPRATTPSKDELLPTRPSLLARLRNHDDSRAWNRGWEEFHNLYHPVVHRYAMKHGLSAAEADDAVQDIVLGLARNLPHFQYDPAKSSFKTWLFRVAKNKIIDHLRKRGRHSRILVELPAGQPETDALLEVADAKVLAPDQEWDLIWEANLRRAALEHVKNRVKPMTMRLYLHHVVDGNSVEDTVRCFRDSQVSPDAVHLAKHRVQKMVDETLQSLREGKMSV